MTVIKGAETVILVICDSLRWDTRDRLPTLGRLAEECVQVENCYMPGSSTATTMPSVMQSRLPIDHDGHGLWLPPSIPTLAEILTEAGIRTVGMHSNTYTSTNYEFDRGFDTFVDIFELEGDEPEAVLSAGGMDADDANVGSSRSMKERLRDVVEVLGVEAPINRMYDQLDRWGIVDNPPYGRAERLADATKAWLDRTDEPRFAWLQFMDTHSPFEPPRELRREVPGADISARRTYDLNERFTSEPETLSDVEFEILRALYEAEALYIDEQMGRIVEALRSSGAWESAAVIVTADHGELFGDRPVPGKDYSANHPQYLCEELTHVPLWIVGGAVPRSTVTELASGIDLAPTIVDAFGVEIPSEWSGTVVGSGDHQEREYVVSASAHTKGNGIEVDDEALHVAVRDEAYAVLWWRSRNDSQVFRREGDAERHLGGVESVPDADRYRVENLLTAAREYDDRNYGVENGKRAEVTDRLRQLGYVD